MNHAQLLLLAQLMGWQDCILEPWRRPLDRGWAASAVLRRRFYAGGGVPWQPAGDKATWRTLRSLERAGHVQRAGQTRGQTWRLTPDADDLARQAIGLPDLRHALRSMSALVDLEAERGDRCTPETILGRRLELLDGRGWGDPDAGDSLAHIQAHVSPLLSRGLATWTATIRGHVLYAVASDAPAPPEPRRHELPKHDPEALHRAYSAGMRACRAAVRKMRGPGFDGETGPTPAAVGVPSMTGWESMK